MHQTGTEAHWLGFRNDNKNVQFSRPIRLAALSSFLCLSYTGAAPLQLPEGQGKAAVQKICSGCHAPEIVMGRHESKDGWSQIVSNMVDKGANGTDDEFNQIIDYLAAHFGKNNEPKNNLKLR